MDLLETLKRELDNPDFWLLVRRFSTAPEGPQRDSAKESVLLHVVGIVKGIEK